MVVSEPRLTPAQRADLRVPWPNVQARAPKDRDECPQVVAREDHDSHWYPNSEGGRTHCVGWHALTRSLVHTRARFHGGYLRGRQSNLVHRSTREGWLTWFPEDFHKESPSYVVFWRVGAACGITMKNPESLDATGVWAAGPHTTPAATQRGRYPEVTLCPRCFPGPPGAPRTCILQKFVL